MASSPIILLQIEGGKMEVETDFLFLGSKITVDGDCSHEIRWQLILGRKVMTNLDTVLKSRDNILPTKVHIVEAMVFPMITYGSESWTVKKAECQRIDAFELYVQCKELEETIELEGQEISSRKLELPRENFMQRWAQ